MICFALVALAGVSQSDALPSHIAAPARFEPHTDYKIRSVSIFYLHLSAVKNKVTTFNFFSDHKKIQLVIYD